MSRANHGSVPTIQEQAQTFIRRYSEVYALFHRAIPKRTLLTPESWAVLEHFRLAGPLTVTEAARHMERAQSVMSGIIDHLASKGLLIRIRDERDKRRVLVWLSEKGRTTIAQESDVLCPDRLGAALIGMRASERESLLMNFGKLLQHAVKTKKGKSK